MGDHCRRGEPNTWEQVVVGHVLPGGAPGTYPDLPSRCDDPLDKGCVRMIRPCDLIGMPTVVDDVEDSLTVYDYCHRDLILCHPCRFHDLHKCFSTSQGFVDLSTTCIGAVESMPPDGTSGKFHPNRLLHQRHLSVVSRHHRMAGRRHSTLMPHSRW